MLYVGERVRCAGAVPVFMPGFGELKRAHLIRRQHQLRGVSASLGTVLDLTSDDSLRIVVRDEGIDFLARLFESPPFSCENPRVSMLVRHLSHALNRIWNVCHLPKLCLIS